MWIRYTKLASHPEQVHRVSGSRQEIVFNATVNGGLVDVRHQGDVERLTQRCPSCRMPVPYVVAMDSYGVTFGPDGQELEPQVPGVVDESVVPDTPADVPPAVSSPPTRRGRPKKR